MPHRSCEQPMILAILYVVGTCPCKMSVRLSAPRNSQIMSYLSMTVIFISLQAVTPSGSIICTQLH